jgi:hypothetical protein
MRRETGIGLFLMVLLTVTALAGRAHAYNALAASDYAFQWNKSYHPDYLNYVGWVSADEDANFVSQALIAGGLLNGSNIPPGYALDSAGCITDRMGLKKFLQDYEHARPVGFSVEGFTPTSLAFGDVVFFGNDPDNPNLVGIVVGYNPVFNDFDIAFHNKTPCSGCLAGNIKTLGEVAVAYGLPAFYHITKPQETTDKQRFYGTGDTFSGPGALSAEILQPGNNYRGYIVNNSNRFYQDMVIATDTALPQYKGCSYLIAGYCCDPEKHAPERGQAFGQPWTSDSPSHWAYWVRQAVLYGTANLFNEFQILNAVWYIVDRVGYPDEIINAIGYPADGPMKFELLYLPLLVTPGVGSGDKAENSPTPIWKASPRPLKDFTEVLERKRTRKR